MSALTESLAKLPPLVKVFLVVGSLVSFGFTLGASTAGMLALPMQVEDNTVKNEAQDSAHVAYDRALVEHRQRMNAIDERLDRVTCLMTAQASGGSVFQCR